MGLPLEQQAHIASLEAQAQALQASRQALVAGDPFAAQALLQGQQRQQAGDGSEEVLQVIQLVNQQAWEQQRQEEEEGQEEERQEEAQQGSEGGEQQHAEEEAAADMSTALGAYDEERYQQYIRQVGSTGVQLALVESRVCLQLQGAPLHLPRQELPAVCLTAWWWHRVVKCSC
jgi:hypothetical protein